MVTPEEEGARLHLGQSSPYLRLKGATWFLQNVESGSDTYLAALLYHETVPVVRGVLTRALRARQLTRDIGDRSPAGNHSEPVRPTPLIEQDLPSMVYHELGPSIGWLKSAIREEVPDYEQSHAWRSIIRLESRVDGLVTLMKVDGGLETQAIDLISLARELWPGEAGSLDLSASAESLVIQADRHLLVTVVANAYQNAIEAQPDKNAVVHVSLGAEAGQFWLRIINEFDGVSFDFRPQDARGLSTRGSRRGRGSRFMQLAASRMGFDLRIRGDSGVAVVSLSGGME